MMICKDFQLGQNLGNVDQAIGCSPMREGRATSVRHAGDPARHVRCDATSRLTGTLRIDPVTCNPLPDDSLCDGPCMTTPSSPRQKDMTLPPDDAARELAQSLMRGARHASLAVTDAETATPGISRIAFGLDETGVPLTLVSALAAHWSALRANPDCALMVGEPAAKGDPLASPRLMVQARAHFVAPDDPDRATLRATWLRDHPKAQLYVDFADFAFVRLHPKAALLNGGFARAYRLSPTDLGL
jgi:heme iron utilization protein